MTPREASRRLFFALWPDEAMQAALAEAVRATAQSSDGRMLPTGNAHLTLAFLGTVPESRLGELNPVASAIAAAFPLEGESLAVTLDCIEHWKKAQILCATASEQPARVAALSEELKRVLSAAGFAPDPKPFRAHVTFARKVQRVTSALQMPPVRWSFRDFRLVESRSDRGGSVYSSCESWVLDGRQNCTNAP